MFAIYSKGNTEGAVSASDQKKSTQCVDNDR